MNISYDINTLKMMKAENNLQYFKQQYEIEEILKLSKNPKSIELLISNIKSIPEFVVYKSKNDAEITNTFLDISCFD